MTTNRTTTPAPTLSELVAIYEIADATAQEDALNAYYQRVYWHCCTAEEDVRRRAEMNASLDVTPAEAARIKPVKKEPKDQSIDWERVPANKQHYAAPVLRQLGYGKTCAISQHYAARRTEYEYQRATHGIYYETYLGRATP